MRTHLLLGCLLLLFGGCVARPPPVGPGSTAPDTTPPISGSAGDTRGADLALLTRFPEPATALAEASTPTRADGLLGRNRTWGAMYSPRFQLGAGFAIRAAVGRRDAARAQLAFLAVEVGLSTQEATGRLPSGTATTSGPLNRQDVASAAAFFLGDACLGVLALERSELRDSVEPARREEVRRRLAGASAWLAGEAEVLLAADAAAPNRLFFDARSFGACGALTSNEAVSGLAARFTDAALGLQHPDGVFTEGGGADTSYQAVALEVGADVPFTSSDHARLDAALLLGAQWLAARVCTGGEIDSSGNTRTCGGGESFLGEPKRFSVTSAFAALAKLGLNANAVTVIDAAARVSAWSQSNPATDTCFEECVSP